MGNSYTNIVFPGKQKWTLSDLREWHDTILRIPDNVPAHAARSGHDLDVQNSGRLDAEVDKRERLCEECWQWFGLGEHMYVIYKPHYRKVCSVCHYKLTNGGKTDD